jgi:hypothetical protein
MCIATNTRVFVLQGLRTGLAALMMMLFAVCIAPGAFAADGEADTPNANGDAPKEETEEEKKPDRSLVIEGWELEKAKGGYTGAVVLRNKSERGLDPLGIRIEAKAADGALVGETEWIKKRDVASDAKIELPFAFDATGEPAIVWVKARYYWSARTIEDHEAIARQDIKAKLSEGVDTTVLDAHNESFFTLEPMEKAPMRYSDAALEAEIARLTGDPVEAPAAGGGELRFTKLERITDEDGNTHLALSVDNAFRAFEAGQLQIQLTLKGGGGETLKTVTHKVKEPVPLGETTLTFPDAGVYFYGWELSYLY